MSDRYGDRLIYNEDNLPPLLTREEEIKYGKQLKSKNKKIAARAREKFIASNIKLVMKIARQYNAHFSFSYEDIVSEGMVGLARGAERYDYTKDVKFSTFSSFWIKQGILRAFANKGRTVRLPVGLQQKMIKAKEYIRIFEDKFGRLPSKKLLKEKFNLSDVGVYDMLYSDFSEYSLDVPLGDEEGSTRLDLTEDEKNPTPDQKCEKNNTHFVLGKHLDKLNNREKEIIIKRYGLFNHDEMTLEEIGDEFDLTRERIRQIQNIALSKLKSIYENYGEKNYA